MSLRPYIRDKLHSLGDRRLLHLRYGAALAAEVAVIWSTPENIWRQRCGGGQQECLRVLWDTPCAWSALQWPLYMSKQSMSVLFWTLVKGRAMLVRCGGKAHHNADRACLEAVLLSTGPISQVHCRHGRQAVLKELLVAKSLQSGSAKA